MVEGNTANLIQLSTLDLVISGVLVLVAGIISVSLKLGLHKRLAIASVRTVVQLILIGYVLKAVFQLSQWWAISAVVLVMLITASRAAVKRSERRFKGDMWRAFVTLVITGLLTTYMVTGVIVSVDPWYQPQYMIPLMGMVLGNGMNGIALSIDHLLESLDIRRGEIEMELAHGASAWEAAGPPLKASVRRGMIPIINSMMVVGLVSLPGMMTGQILAGADPLEAVKYQIVVMFMIAAATSMGCIMLALLVYKRLFNERHQLSSQLIHKN